MTAPGRTPLVRVAGAVLAGWIAANVAGCGVERPVRVSSAGDARAGAQLIGSYGCGSCHTIPGIAEADGVVAPPLTAFGRRAYVAGDVVNNADNLARWIVDPESIDPGTAMPDLGVTPSEARSIAAYLLELG